MTAHPWTNVEGLRVRRAGDTPSDYAWQIALPGGPWISVGRYGEDYDGQLYVVVNSESMPDAQHTPEGEPYMEVTLNDGPLYDREAPA